LLGGGSEAEKILRDAPLAVRTIREESFYGAEAICALLQSGVCGLGRRGALRILTVRGEDDFCAPKWGDPDRTPREHVRRGKVFEEALQERFEAASQQINVVWNSPSNRKAYKGGFTTANEPPGLNAVKWAARRGDVFQRALRRLSDAFPLEIGVEDRLIMWVRRVSEAPVEAGAESE
jgi:hypothetical protein